MNMKYDDEELADIANFIRSVFKVKVKIEHFVLFNNDGSYDRIAAGIYDHNIQKFRNPDLMIIKDKKLLFCVEIDGSIHDVKVDATDKRNEQYKKAGIDLIVVNKAELKLGNTSKFEYIETEVSKRLN